LKVIERAERGEGVVPMAGRLGISRRLLHDWMKAWKAHGPEGVQARATVIQCPLIGKILSGHVDSRAINAGGLAL
jgi:transposase-like protein